MLGSNATIFVMSKHQNELLLNHFILSLLASPQKMLFFPNENIFLFYRAVIQKSKNKELRKKTEIFNQACSKAVNTN